jgi:hypothetical protein
MIARLGDDQGQEVQGERDGDQGKEGCVRVYNISIDIEFASSPPHRDEDGDGDGDCYGKRNAKLFGFGDRGHCFSLSVVSAGLPFVPRACARDAGCNHAEAFDGRVQAQTIAATQPTSV